MKEKETSIVECDERIWVLVEEYAENVQERILANLDSDQYMRINRDLEQFLASLRNTLTNIKYAAKLEALIKSLLELHPRLTNNNIRLCIFLYMGMTNKEIANLTFVSHSSVKVACNRLRKKLMIRDDKVSIKAYLMRLKSQSSERYN